MPHANESLLFFFIVFLSAQIGADIAQRLRLPSVIGEIAVGVLIGPSALNWIHITEPLYVIAEVGAVLLLFSVGMETRLDQLKEVGWQASAVGSLGVIIPFAAGAAWAAYYGFPSEKALFVGAAFVATSAGITAKILQEMGVLARIESRIILAAAVVDDILAMLILGVVTAVAAGHSVDILGLFFVIAQAVVFVVLITAVGTRFMKRFSGLLEIPLSIDSPLTISLALCLGLAVAASYIGLAAIIGAFLAGVIVAESKQKKSLERQMRSILVFIVPFFFVVTGAQVDLAALLNTKTLLAVLVVTILAFLSKFAGCGLGALSLGWRSASIIGLGMVPRGEVGIIVAGLGLSLNVITNDIYSIIIAMSLITSISAPPLLKLLFKPQKMREA